MKKQLVILLALLSLGTSAWAQKEYKVAKSAGRLNLNINGAIIEGYNGNEVIFSSQMKEDEVVDERAKGLKAISGSGFTDNTGLGIDVTVSGEDINVNSVSKRTTGILTIKVPQHIKIYFSNTNNMRADEIILKNLMNEIEISTTYNKIKLENNTGPMNIKTVYGSVDATFTGEIKGPVSIVSVYSYVDVSLPAATKANVELSTSYGKLYAADEFKIAVNTNKRTTSASGSLPPVTVSGKGVKTEAVSVTNTKRNEDNEVIVGSNYTNNGETVIVRGYSNYREGENIKGTINGGGIDLILKSNYKNVYLRQK